MPKGPRGEVRPADAIGCTVQIGKIATGEENDTQVSIYRRRSGVAGAMARKYSLFAGTRSEIARNAAKERWSVT